MVELGADAAGVLDPVGPRDGHTLPGAAELRRHLLDPFERRIERPRPCHRHVRIGDGGAPDVIELEHVGDRQIEDAVIGGVLVRRAAQRAFGARAVVAKDVDDQRVVELAHVLDRLDHTADLVVGVGGVGGEYLGLPRKSFFSSADSVSHFWRSSGHAVSSVLAGIDAEPLLVGENLIAHGVPAHVELAFELVDPFGRGLVRRVSAAGQ